MDFFLTDEQFAIIKKHLGFSVYLKLYAEQQRLLKEKEEKEKEEKKEN
jgi:hypothetical protein